MAYLSMPVDFIFCIEEVDDAPDPSGYPVGIDKDTLFLWMYRIRTWNVSASTESIVATSNGDEFTASATCPNFFFDFPYDTEIATETDFACTSQTGTFNKNVSDSDFQPGANASVFFGMNILVDFKNTKFYSGLYYPLIAFSVGASAIAGYEGEDPAEMYELIFSFPPDAGTPTDLIVTMNGVDITLSGTLSTNGAPGLHLSAINTPANYQVTMSPTFWWTYTTSLGDTYAAGSPDILIDPFTIQGP